MSRKRFAVIGLGQFGKALCAALAGSGCEVLAVDRDPNAIEAVKSAVAMAAIADVRDRAAMKELFTSRFDAAVVAIGTNLEAAILATLFLREAGVPRIVAEASSPDRAEVLERVGATQIISPELEVGKRLAKRLANPNLIEFLPLLEGYAAIEVEAPEWTHGKTLAELDFHRKHGLAVLAILAPGGKYALVPGGSARIEKGAKLTLVGRSADLERFGKGRNGKESSRG
ncbi:MAG: potassium channel family protein [Planctomycetaceae bacterium]